MSPKIKAIKLFRRVMETRVDCCEKNRLQRRTSKKVEKVRQIKGDKIIR